jgi:hypothetical protein
MWFWMLCAWVWVEINSLFVESASSCEAPGVTVMERAEGSLLRSWFLFAVASCASCINCCANIVCWCALVIYVLAGMWCGVDACHMAAVYVDIGGKIS